MPAPLAKGIVITVTVIVAAGIAVYESPEVKKWIQNSRRKIALALHNLGDGINPDRQAGDQKDDISMTEEIGPEAEERRQKAKEDILRRRAILEAKQEQKDSGRSFGSFEALIDSDGRLKQTGELDRVIKQVDIKATGVEASASSQFVVHRGGGENETDDSRSMSDDIPKMDPEHRRAILEHLNTDLLHFSTLGSETPSNHPSESLISLTPTSEVPDTDIRTSIHIREEGTSQLSSPSVISFSHTEDGEPDYYYAHPHQNGQSSTQPGPVDQENNNVSTQVSSAPSIASNLSHIENDPFETASEASISDLGRHQDGTYTPVSWSEVGSVISSNDGSHT